MSKVIWFGLPMRMDFGHNPPELHTGYFVGLLVPFFIWVEGTFGSGEEFRFFVYEGSYFRALYDWIFNPEKFND